MENVVFQSVVHCVAMVRLEGKGKGKGKGKKGKDGDASAAKAKTGGAIQESAAFDKKMTIFCVEKRRRGRRCPYETHNFEDESDYFRRSCGPLHLTSTFWVFVVSLEKNRISVRSQFS